ncbi:MAG: SpoIID/LytB domain-containing protein [Acidimicrobiales bacterium]
MAQKGRLVALVAITIAPTAVGPVVYAQDAPESWVAPVVRFEPLKAEGSRAEVPGLGAYRGTVEVRAAGGLSIYNELPLEDYVKGIVEMPAAWPAAALQAQAIAARTYGLNIQRSRGEICPDDACQFYMGLFGQERDGGQRWAAAVDATAGQALLAGGQPILAMFSGSNGGRSVAGGSAYLPAVDDPDDAASPTHHWHYTLPLSDFTPFVDVPDGSTLVRIVRDGDSIVAVSKPENGEPSERTRGADEFASAVNASLDAPAGLPLPFPSMTFTLDTEGDQAVVDGGGWGHGRGMSQWGAYGKAQRGLSASQITAAYYGGLRPTALSDEQAATKIRVALARGRGRTAVTLSRPSRVVAGDGTVLVPLTFGEWQIRTERGGVRVTGPDDTDQPLAVTDAELTSRRRVVGSPPTVHFAVTGPAVVTVHMKGPGVASAPVSIVMLEGGVQTVPLPAPRTSGDHTVTIEADGGPGRRAAAEVKFAVRPHVVFEASEAESAQVRPAWATLAGLLAAVVALGLAAVAYTRHSR